VEIRSFVTTPFAENAYVLIDSGEAMVIDPGEATDELLAALDGVRVTALVNTHAHIDHVGGNAEIKRRTGAEFVCHADAREMLDSVPMQGRMFGMSVEPSPKPDRLIAEGDTLRVGDVALRIVDVPGHAPGHIALVGDGFVISGDVLFAGSIGRTDLYGGDMDLLMESIRTKLLPLPDDTVVLSGHGPPTTIGAERESNPFILAAQ
jgi:glyoxylase-like metal-dependent hydrolase (beta-lactamase superfamily II)